MDYKLVLSDLDGTLLNSDGELLSATESTIIDLVNSGVLFATASARTKAFTKSAVAPIMQACCANACMNGAYVETSKGDILIDNPLDKEKAEVLIEELEKAQASYCCIYKDHVFKKGNDSIQDERMDRAFRMYHGSYSEEPLPGNTNSGIYIILAAAVNISPVMEAVKGLEIVQTFHFSKHSCGYDIARFESKGVDKSTAMKRIAEYFSIDLSETIAIGDAYFNDRPMIEQAGCGVAMKNAHEDILKIADRVTEKDNNEDGVGDFLRTLFNGTGS